MITTISGILILTRSQVRFPGLMLVVSIAFSHLTPEEVRLAIALGHTYAILVVAMLLSCSIHQGDGDMQF